MTEPTKTPAQETAKTPEKTAQKAPVLAVEGKFDRAVYGGISYGAQALSGIALTYLFKHGPGKKQYERFSEWFAKSFVSKISSKRGEDAIKAADTWITVSTMVMVGNMFLIPVKWIENQRPKILRKWNSQENAKREERGEIISPEERKAQEARLTDIENGPKQNWWSLIFGRVFALGAVYIGVKTLEGKPNKTMEGWTSGAVSWVLNKIGLKKIGNADLTKQIAEISFNDGFYSIISAGGLYAYSHFVHPLKGDDGKDNASQKLDTHNLPAVEALEEKIESKIDKHIGFSEKLRKLDHRNTRQSEQRLTYADKIAKENAAGQGQLVGAP